MLKASVRAELDEERMKVSQERMLLDTERDRLRAQAQHERQEHADRLQAIAEELKTERARLAEKAREELTTEIVSDDLRNKRRNNAVTQVCQGVKCCFLPVIFGTDFVERYV